jgi:hypothetical protein
LILRTSDQKPQDSRQLANRQPPYNPGNNIGEWQHAEGDKAIRQVAKTRDD